VRATHNNERKTTLQIRLRNFKRLFSDGEDWRCRLLAYRIILTPCLNKKCQLIFCSVSVKIIWTDFNETMVDVSRNKHLTKLCIMCPLHLKYVSALYLGKFEDWAVNAIITMYISMNHWVESVATITNDDDVRISSVSMHSIIGDFQHFPPDNVHFPCALFPRAILAISSLIRQMSSGVRCGCQRGFNYLPPADAFVFPSVS